MLIKKIMVVKLLEMGKQEQMMIDLILIHTLRSNVV